MKSIGADRRSGVMEAKGCFVQLTNAVAVEILLNVERET